MAAWYERDPSETTISTWRTTRLLDHLKNLDSSTFRTARDHRQHFAAVTEATTVTYRWAPSTFRRPTAHDTDGPGDAGHPSRLRPDKAHDPMPTHPMGGTLPESTSPSGTGEPAGEASFELVVVLEVTLATVPTFEPAATPHQRGAAAAHPQVTNPLGPSVPHLVAAEPTMAAPRPLPSRFDFNLKTLNRVDPHSRHGTPDRCSRTCITSDIEASPWIGDVGYSPIPAGPHPHSKDFTPPNPRFRAGPAFLAVSRRSGASRPGGSYHREESRGPLRGVPDDIRNLISVYPYFIEGLPTSRF